MSRFPYPDPAELSDANRHFLETTPPGNMTRMMVGLGEAFLPLIELWKAYRFRGKLPPQIREIAISRTSHLSDCAYELYRHKPVAFEVGLTEARYQAIFGALPSPLFSDAENAAAMLVDALVTQAKADVAIRDRALEHLGADQVRELILVVGQYMFLCRFCMNLDVEIEEGEFVPVKAPQ